MSNDKTEFQVALENVVGSGRIPCARNVTVGDSRDVFAVELADVDFRDGKMSDERLVISAFELGECDPWRGALIVQTKLDLKKTSVEQDSRILFDVLSAGGASRGVKAIHIDGRLAFAFDIPASGSGTLQELMADLEEGIRNVGTVFQTLCLAAWARNIHEALPEEEANERIECGKKALRAAMNPPAEDGDDVEWVT